MLTTNANEAHWSQFKDRLSRRGRVTIGILVAFIAGEVVPGLLADWKRSGLGSVTPHWQQEFNREFRGHMAKNLAMESVAKYASNVKRWHCACPDYARGRFRMCKHLVCLLTHHRTGVRWDISQLRVVPRMTSPFVAIEYLHDAALLGAAPRPLCTRSPRQQPQFHG